MLSLIKINKWITFICTNSSSINQLLQITFNFRLGYNKKSEVWQLSTGHNLGTLALEKLVNCTCSIPVWDFVEEWAQLQELSQTRKSKLPVLSLLRPPGASLSRAQPMVIIHVLLPPALVSDLVRLGYQKKKLCSRYDKFKGESKTIRAVGFQLH